ncbi:MAG: hypothetical protein Q9167_005364 [Letrouitia subvulpina]
MLFPELEQGLLSTGYYERLQLLEALTTDVDLLEIAQARPAAVNWQQGLNHEKLLTWFKLQSELKSRLYELYLKLHPSTLEWFQTQFNLPLLFFDCVVNISKWAKTGNGYFVRHNEEGRVIGIDTLYRLGGIGGAVHIWSSHQLDPKSTTYVISNCPQGAKDRIVSCMSNLEAGEYNRLLLVDAFLANFCSDQYKKEIEEARRASEIPWEGLAASFENLHRLSQTWYILYEDLIDFEERVQFLLEVCSGLKSAYGLKPRIKTAETLKFLASRTQIWRRWVASYNTRTKNRIDLFFNLAIQKDNRINIEIARLTKDIAQESRKDSSSMITIAALTMVFLPGTFVAALFSMVYFTNDKDKDGNIRLVVMPQLWQFFVITIGLTVLVFMAWILWQRMQNKKLNRSRKEVDDGTFPQNIQSVSLPIGSAFELTALPERAPPPVPQVAPGPYRSRYFDHPGKAVDPNLGYQW